MLKPKYVHGVNADEASRSQLHRLQNERGQNVAPADDLPSDPFDDGTLYWSWTLG